MVLSDLQLILSFPSSWLSPQLQSHYLTAQFFIHLMHEKESFANRFPQGAPFMSFSREGVSEGAVMGMPRVTEKAACPGGMRDHSSSGPGSGDLSCSLCLCCSCGTPRWHWASSLWADPICCSLSQRLCGKIDLRLRSSFKFQILSICLAPPTCSDSAPDVLKYSLKPSHTE